MLDLCEKDTVSTFEDGKFSDAVRAVMSLLKLNISTRNICPAIKTVLEGLANIQTDRLPSYGTANYIMYEAKCLALIEAGKASLRDKQGKAAQNVLMNDGTSKLKKKYKTTIISTSEGVKTFGLQLLATETSESLLEANVRVLNDVAKVVSRVEGRSEEEVLNELLGTVTGTMSDRAEVMKKFNKLFNDYRKNTLAVSSDLTDIQKQSINDIQNHFCFLHVVINLGEDAYSKRLMDFDKCTLTDDA